MRFVVFGAGGIGGVVGARLFEHGYDVTLIARGLHLDRLRADGLRVEDPDGSATFPIPAVGSSAEVDLMPDDVVLLTMKTQDTTGALDSLAAFAPASTAIVCVQNGVANERKALRRFDRVYGVAVMCPTLFLVPGVVQAHSAPTTGLLDIGRYPAGSGDEVDEMADRIAGAFMASSFQSVARPDIMRWKYRKLISNLGNAIEALCGSDARGGRLSDLAAAEAEACLDSAGIDRATSAEDVARRGDFMNVRPIGGQRRQGGSTWQSLARGAGGIETDYLNGEIVLLGRLHGLATPVNATLQSLMRRAATEGLPPGTMTESAILELIPADP